MPPEKAEVLEDWLRKAGKDLEVCQYLFSAQPRFVEAAAFHAQQAAEKSLKAFLTYHDVRFRKTHDLKKIGELILKIDRTLEPLLERAKVLNPFAVEIRYPGEDMPITLDDSKEHFVIAKTIYEEILKRIPSDAHPKDNSRT